MSDGIDVGKCRVGNVAHVGLHQLHAIGEVLERRSSPVEAVEDAYAVPALEQPLAKDDADVAGAAGDEDFHAIRSASREYLHAKRAEALAFKAETDRKSV